MTFVQNSNYCRRRLAAAVAAIAAVCAGPAVPVALAQEVTPCAALAGRSIEPALIGLPGGPARIAAAAVERLPASQAAESTIGYCKVLGEIAPLDPAAPPWGGTSGRILSHLARGHEIEFIPLPRPLNK
jgi:hypothetical protein